MLNPMGKKIFTILRSKILFIYTYAVAFVNMRPNIRDFGHNIFGLCEYTHNWPLSPSLNTDISNIPK